MTAAVAILTSEEISELLDRAVLKALDAHSSDVEILTLKQAGSFLGRHPKVLAKYVRDGSLPALHIGRQYRFDKRDLIEWLRKQPVKK